MVLLQLEEDNRSPLLWGSLLFSALSVAYLVAVTELDLDQSEHRKLYARIHGYMPSKKARRRLVVGGTIVFISNFLLAKLLALSVLSTGSAAHAAVWLGGRAPVLWMLLLCRGHVPLSRCRHGLGDGERLRSGRRVRFVFGRPFPLLRQPGFMGPSLYLPWMFYSLLVNPVMIAVGLRLDSGGRIEVSWKGTRRARFRAPRIVLTHMICLALLRSGGTRSTRRL